MSEKVYVLNVYNSFTPNWIVRTLNAQQDTLLRKYDIHYVAYRTKEGKSLSLRWDGVR